MLTQTRLKPFKSIRSRSWLSGALLISLLIVLNACGWATGASSSKQNSASASPSDKPSKLQIQIGELSPASKQNPPLLTVTSPETIQKLYTAIYALGWMPAQQACTDELGPSYTLTFFEADKTLTTMKAERYGCRPISIKGEAQQRRTTQDFWTMLDQAIYEAAPPARVETVAFMHTPSADQPAQTARVTTAATAQRLYDAIVKLPLSTGTVDCSNGSLLVYHIVFTSAQQTIPGTFDKSCGFITLFGNYQSRGGTFKTSPEFSQLFSQIVGTATFTPARPDRLTLSTTDATTSKQAIVADQTLLQNIYHTFYSLPVVPRPADCPSGKDKVAGKGTHYSLAFSQWSLPILNLEAYKGSCTTILVPSANGARQDNQAFWDLVHQADSAS